MKKQLVATLFTVALAVAPALGAAMDDGVTSTKFNVLLSPSHQVPPLEGIDISGKATIEFNVKRANGNVMMVVADFHVDWRAGQMEELRAMHIHMGKAGMNGGIVIDTSLGAQAAATSGAIFRQVKITDAAGIATVMDIMANPGDYYLNLHSVSSPPGVLRGQLEMDAAAQLKMVEGNLQKSLDEIQKTLDNLANFIL